MAVPIQETISRHRGSGAGTVFSYDYCLPAARDGLVSVNTGVLASGHAMHGSSEAHGCSVHGDVPAAVKRQRQVCTDRLAACASIEVVMALEVDSVLPVTARGA